MQKLGADTGLCGLLRGDRLVGAVDIFLCALAGNAQAVVADAEDEIGQAAEPPRLSRICEKRDPRNGLSCLVHPVRHAFSLSIFAS